MLPDGSSVWEKKLDKNSYTGGYSENFDQKNSTLGENLITSVSSNQTIRNSDDPIIPIILIFIGTINLVFPKLIWYLKYGWKFKDAEPSDIAIILARLAGIILIISGIIRFFT